MRTVRAINRHTGEVKSTFKATEVTVITRQSLAELYNYACLNPSCGASFHWRKPVRAGGNSVYREETFVKNKTTAHALACPYDYSELASQYSNTLYVENDRLHVRINFPLGSAPTDISIPADPRKAFNKAASGINIKPKVEPIDSLRKLTDFLEKNFGNIESMAMSDINFDYQGRIYVWDDLFVASDNYKKLYQVAYDKKKQEDESSPVIVVIKPRAEIDRNKNNRPRFVCEPQYAKPGYKELSVKPILVCEDDEMAGYINRVVKNNGAILVAARPWFAREKRYKRPDIPVYLMARQVAQLARIDEKKYWRLISGRRHQQDFLSQLETFKPQFAG